MTHTDILLLILGLLGAGSVALLAFILHEVVIDLKEIKTVIEER